MILSFHVKIGDLGSPWVGITTLPWLRACNLHFVVHSIVKYPRCFDMQIAIFVCDNVIHNDLSADRSKEYTFFPSWEKAPLRQTVIQAAAGNFPSALMHN